MTRNSLLLTDDGLAFSLPATTDDEGFQLCSSRKLPTPNPGDIETSLPTVIGAASAAVNAAVDNDGFSPISRSTGFKTTPFHLATATTTTVSTTVHAAHGDYNSSESSDKEKSQPLLPDQPATLTTLNKDPVTLLAAISKSEHQRNLAFIKERSKIQKIGRRASDLMESIRLVAESMSTTNTAALTAQMDGVDANLAAIK
jgi:hypothetical protein